MTAAPQKILAEQKLFEVLENCKRISVHKQEIPKDDRLLLRKWIKEKDQILMQILSEPSTQNNNSGHRRLQIRLRKHLQKEK